MYPLLQIHALNYSNRRLYLLLVSPLVFWTAIAITRVY